MLQYIIFHLQLAPTFSPIIENLSYFRNTFLWLCAGRPEAVVLLCKLRIVNNQMIMQNKASTIAKTPLGTFISKQVGLNDNKFIFNNNQNSTGVQIT